MLNHTISNTHPPRNAITWTNSPRAAVIFCGVLALLMVAGCARFYDGSMAGGHQASHTSDELEAANPNAHPASAIRARRPQTEEPVRFHGAGAADAEGRAEVEARLADARSGRRDSLGLFGDVGGTTSDWTDGASGVDNLRRITYAGQGADFDPAVDPSGEILIFASTRHRQNEAIYRKRINGSTVTQLTDTQGRDVMPSFSPDGNRIAFASDRSGTWDIYIMDADGGQAMQVTDDNRHNIHPSFSPDGRKLVYSSFGGPASQWELVVVDLDQPGTRQYLGPGLFPQWSPTDDRILYQRARERGGRAFSVWTVSLDDNGEAGAPTEIAASTNAAVITPAWAPDGKHIVFCTVVNPSADEQEGERPTRADIWVVRADGSGRARLTRGGFANLQPTWASDGTIYFVSDRGDEGVEGIWGIRPDQAVRLASPEARRSSEPTASVPTE